MDVKEETGARTKTSVAFQKRLDWHMTAIYEWHKLWYNNPLFARIHVSDPVCEHPEALK